MPRRTAVAFAALTVTAGLLAGCGGSSSGGTSKPPAANDSSLSPAAELSSAVTALGDTRTLTASLKLGASGSQLLSFVKAQDKSAHLTAAQASMIAGLQISFQVSAPSGSNLSELSGLSNSGAANISVLEGTKSLLSIRFVKQVLYVQVALKDVLNALGMASTYRQIESASGQLPGFVGSLVQGKWVSLPLSTLKSLGSQLGATAPASADASKSKEIIAALKSLLTKDVTVTRTTSGDTDSLTLTGNLRTLATDITSTFASEIPGAGAALGDADLSNVPDKDVSINATVTSGALSTISFDLGQLAKSGKGSLPIQLTFAQNGPTISAPSGAVAVDLSQLGQLLGAFSGGFGSS